MMHARAAKRIKSTRHHGGIKGEEEESEEVINVFIHARDTCVYTTRIVSSLYKIVIHPNNLIPQTCPPNPLPLIQPVFRFDCKNYLYPSGMSFVTVGSNLYFMGGSISYLEQILSLAIYSDVQQPPCASCFPPDVFVFDSITSQLLDSSSPYWIPPMLTGKPEDPIIFLVEAQIFVLSSQHGPQGLVHFETFNRILNKWIPLQPPNPHFFLQWKAAQGSIVIGRKLLVTYLSEYDYHLLWYDIDSESWTQCTASHNHDIYRNLVLVGDTLYSFFVNYVTTFSVADVSRKLKTYTSFCPVTMQDWPINANTYGDSTRLLIHIQGLKGTHHKSACFGFVEFFTPFQSEYVVECMPPCELRFVVFEAIGGKPYKVLHACQFSSDLSSSCVLSGAASASVSTS